MRKKFPSKISTCLEPVYYTLHIMHHFLLLFPTTGTWVILGSFSFCFLTIQLYTYLLYGGRNCLGAPYIYVSVHSDVRNVYKFSRDGCLLMEDVLVGAALTLKTEFRCMAIGTYDNDGALYIANSEPGKSSVLVFGTCLDNGQRPFITTVVTNHKKDVEITGVDHTYGVGKYTPISIKTAQPLVCYRI